MNQYLYYLTDSASVFTILWIRNQILKPHNEATPMIYIHTLSLCPIPTVAVSQHTYARTAHCSIRDRDVAVRVATKLAYNWTNRVVSCCKIAMLDCSPARLPDLVRLRARTHARMIYICRDVHARM